MNTPPNSRRKCAVSMLLSFLAGYGWALLTRIEPVAQRRQRAKAFIQRVMDEAAP